MSYELYWNIPFIGISHYISFLKCYLLNILKYSLIDNNIFNFILIFYQIIK